MSAKSTANFQGSRALLVFSMALLVASVALAQQALAGPEVVEARLNERDELVHLVLRVERRFAGEHSYPAFTALGELRRVEGHEYHRMLEETASRDGECLGPGSTTTHSNPKDEQRYDLAQGAQVFDGVIEKVVLGVSVGHPATALRIALKRRPADEDSGLPFWLLLTEGDVTLDGTRYCIGRDRRPAVGDEIAFAVPNRKQSIHTRGEGILVGSASSASVLLAEKGLVVRAPSGLYSPDQELIGRALEEAIGELARAWAVRPSSSTADRSAGEGGG